MCVSVCGHLKGLYVHVLQLMFPLSFSIVSTPEAVHSISVSVQRQSRSQEPIHSRSHSSSPPKSTLHHLHQLPPSTDSVGDTQRAAPSSQKSTLPLKSRRKREKSSQARPHPPITSSSSRVSGREATPTIPRTGVRGLGPPQIMPTNPRLMEAMPAAHDILASQVYVDSVCGVIDYECPSCLV